MSQQNTKPRKPQSLDWAASKLYAGEIPYPYYTGQITNVFCAPEKDTISIYKGSLLCEHLRKGGLLKKLSVNSALTTYRYENCLPTWTH